MNDRMNWCGVWGRSLLRGGGRGLSVQWRTNSSTRAMGRGQEDRSIGEEKGNNSVYTSNEGWWWEEEDDGTGTPGRIVKKRCNEPNGPKDHEWPLKNRGNDREDEGIKSDEMVGIDNRGGGDDWYVLWSLIWMAKKWSIDGVADYSNFKKDSCADAEEKTKWERSSLSLRFLYIQKNPPDNDKE